MNITLKETGSKSTESFESELRVNGLKQVDDCFLVEVPEDTKTFESLKIIPISFMASCTLQTTKETRDHFHKINKDQMDLTHAIETDLLVFFYLNDYGSLEIGSVQGLPSTLMIDTDTNMVFIDYGKYLRWTQLAGKESTTLFKYAKSMIQQNTDYKVNEEECKIGFL
jgi:hypothetical protein